MQRHVRYRAIDRLIEKTNALHGVPRHALAGKVFRSCWFETAPDKTVEAVEIICTDDSTFYSTDRSDCMYACELFLAQLRSRTACSLPPSKRRRR